MKQSRDFQAPTGEMTALKVNLAGRMPDVPEDSGGSPLDLAGDLGRVGDLVYPQERNGQEKEHRDHGVPGL